MIDKTTTPYYWTQQELGGYSKIEGSLITFANEIATKEREVITKEFQTRLQNDLDCKLTYKQWKKQNPNLSEFIEWLNEREKFCAKH